MPALDASTHPFRLTVRPERAEVHVVPAGDLDLSTVDRLEREIAGLRATGWRRIVLDLRAVTFLDSVALRTLMALRNDARRADHALSLVPGPPTVQRVFELTRTRALFDWRD